MWQSIMITVIAFTLVSIRPPLALAETSSVEEREALTRGLQGAWLPLESGLAVSGGEGTPLSAKYEIDDGALQLSVYTVKAGAGDTFVEVIVDYSTGVVVRAEPISDGGDLAAAHAQKDAMDRATRSLADVTAGAVSQWIGAAATTRGLP